MTLLWKHPFSAILDKVYWHYSEWLPDLKANDNIIFKEGLNINEIDTTFNDSCKNFGFSGHACWV